MLEKFTYKLPIQARWNDLDPLGHVNNGVFITYFELGRGRYMNIASSSWDWNKNMFLIGKISATFLKELTMLHKNPEIWVRTVKFGTKSFEIQYAVTSQKEDGTHIIHATGESTQVMFDMKTKQTIPIPEWMKNDLILYEKQID